MQHANSSTQNHSTQALLSDIFPGEECTLKETTTTYAFVMKLNPRNCCAKKTQQQWKDFFAL